VAIGFHVHHIFPLGVDAEPFELQGIGGMIDLHGGKRVGEYTKDGMG
jgi:hypothetical protein